MAYAAGSTKDGFSAGNYLELLAAPARIVSVSLGLYYWRDLRRRWRIAVGLVILLIVLVSIGAVVRSAIVATTVIAAASIGAAWRSTSKRLTPYAKRFFVITAVLAGVGFAIYSSFITEKRFNGVDPLFNPLTSQFAEWPFVEDALEPTAYRALVSAAFYVSHGYYRLGQAFELQPAGLGYGVANSPFLMRNAARIFGLDRISDRSLGMLLDGRTGEGLGLLWSTSYTWWASDLTFPGTVLLMAFLGYSLARSWIEALRGIHPLAVAAFACLSFVVFTIPMTNALQDGGGVAGYVGIPIAWVLSTKRRAVARQTALARATAAGSAT